MKTYKHLNICFLILIYCFGFLLSLYAQEDKLKVENTERKTTIFKVIKKEGWHISQFEESDLISNKVSNIQEKPIFIKYYKFKKGGDLLLDFFSQQNDGSILVSSISVEAKSGGIFSLNGKTFAYQINYVPFKLAENKKKDYIGVIITMYYLDEDGDGVFETRHQTYSRPDKIPDWVEKPKS